MPEKCQSIIRLQISAIGQKIHFCDCQKCLTKLCIKILYEKIWNEYCIIGHEKD